MHSMYYPQCTSKSELFLEKWKVEQEPTENNQIDITDRVIILDSSVVPSTHRFQETCGFTLYLLSIFQLFSFLYLCKHSCWLEKNWAVWSVTFFFSPQRINMAKPMTIFRLAFLSNSYCLIYFTPNLISTTLHSSALFYQIQI